MDSLKISFTSDLYLWIFAVFKAALYRRESLMNQLMLKGRLEVKSRGLDFDHVDLSPV